MATPQSKNPCPGVDENYKFGKPFLGHHYYIHSLSGLCLGVNKIFKGIMHFLYMTDMAMPLHKKPCPPGVIKLTILVDPFMVIITIYIVCLIYASE